MGKNSLNIPVVFRMLGFLLLLESITLAVSGVVAWSYQGDDVRWFAWSTFITLLFGGIFSLIGRNAGKNTGKREGLVFVALSWILFSAFGMLPFLLGGYIDSVYQAFFETMSGLTTTGSSVMTNIESMPHGILFWRSLIQWLGGMGIILLTLAIMPVLNIGNLHLFTAEVPGPTVDKLHPRISTTAKILWSLYLILTLTQTLLLKLAGMDLFDALCHSFTTMATGGFSTKDSSIAYWQSPLIEYLITGFMFLAGMNFSLLFWATTGKLKKIRHNDEFTWYLFIALIASAILAFGLWQAEGYAAADAIRTGLFNIVSFMTTTGYTTTTAYGTWQSLLWSLFLIVMLIGGMSGSTAGGMKVIRIILVFRHSLNEMKRLLHPNAVIPTRFNGKPIPVPVVSAACGFLVLYLALIAAGCILLMAQGVDFISAIGAVVTSISNVGPGFGAYSSNFSQLPELSTWVLSFLMMAGRLELFTVLVLFLPSFWRK